MRRPYQIGVREEVLSIIYELECIQLRLATSRDLDRTATEKPAMKLKVME